MNTENMTLFLAQVSAAHKEDFIVMVSSFGLALTTAQYASNKLK
jgi:hypothetical protein